MRTRLALVCVLAALASAVTSPALAQEKGLKPGFRDLKWKDPLPDGMTKKVRRASPRAPSRTSFLLRSSSKSPTLVRPVAT